jgi:hypothetical protein
MFFYVFFPSSLHYFCTNWRHRRKATKACQSEKQPHPTLSGIFWDPEVAKFGEKSGKSETTNNHNMSIVRENLLPLHRFSY